MSKLFLSAPLLFLPELAWAAILNMAENPVEISYTVKAAGEADFRYAPASVCHKFLSRFHPFSLHKLDKRCP